MDEFLSGLANYTEKENPYHSIDACPGTDFYNTEEILKLFYPLIVFHLDGGFRILCNQKVIGFDQLRYYLNYVILPRVTQYWKQTPTKKDMEKELETLDLVKDAVQPNVKRKCKGNKIVDVLDLYRGGTIIICEENIQQMNEYIAKYYPGTVAEEEYQKLDTTRVDRITYIRMKINEYNRDIKIKETLDRLKQLDFGLGPTIERIKTYLQTIRYAGEYK